MKPYCTSDISLSVRPLIISIITLRTSFVTWLIELIVRCFSHLAVPFTFGIVINMDLYICSGKRYFRHPSSTGCHKHFRCDVIWSRCFPYWHSLQSILNFCAALSLISLVCDNLSCPLNFLFLRLSKIFNFP